MKGIYCARCGVTGITEEFVLTHCDCPAGASVLRTYYYGDDQAGPVGASARADTVNHPPHYKDHPSGVECIQITEHMNFCLGNAMKYLWRADRKGDAIEDLKKARWYVDREIQRREAQN